LIEVQNLTKYFKDFCAVDSISMTIRKGEILGLLGPNGAGKTTTLRMLTGYFRPDSGTIKIKDFQMPRDIIKIKSLIGYLPESAPGSEFQDLSSLHGQGRLSVSSPWRDRQWAVP